MQRPLRDFDVDDADARVVVGEETEALSANAPAQVGRVPDEAPAGAEVSARLVACMLDNRALVVRRIDVEVRAESIERHDRPSRQVLRDPAILARAGEAGHEHDLAAEALARSIGGILLPSAEPEEARVVGGKGQRGVEAAALAAVLGEELDVVEDAPLVLAGSAARVGLGEEREEIAARRLADARDSSNGSSRSSSQNGT